MKLDFLLLPPDFQSCDENLFFEDISTTAPFGPQLSIMALVSMVSIKKDYRTKDKNLETRILRASNEKCYKRCREVHQNDALQCGHTALQ
jgi:hypothetical protein